MAETPNRAGTPPTCTTCAHFSSACVSFFRDRKPAASCAQGHFSNHVPENTEDWLALIHSAESCGQYRGK